MAGLDAAGRSLPSGVHQHIDLIDPDIINRMTAGADKVLMRLHVSVEMLRAAIGGYPPDLSELREKREISVDGAEADVRELFAQAGINGLRCGMIPARHQKVPNRLALSAVFQCRHGALLLLKSVIVLIYIKNIADKREIVKMFHI